MEFNIQIPAVIANVCKKYGIAVESVVINFANEFYIPVQSSNFGAVCLELHEKLESPVMAMFACDERKSGGKFVLYCGFVTQNSGQWIFVQLDIPPDNPKYESLSKSVYSSSLFEREIKEMFGIEPTGNPDTRRLHLHSEIWPEGDYPLRKDFVPGDLKSGLVSDYKFNKVDGEGVFEVPVGPVHAGIIAPGHFRFSVAGEPIINLEIRLGFAHRGVEKIFEGKSCSQAVAIAERVSGDASFAHSWAFCHAVEHIQAIAVPPRAQMLRVIFLELERLYNHVNDIGGIAVDVGFTFPAALASLIKESILDLNRRLIGHRYLKGVNTIGGVFQGLEAGQIGLLRNTLKDIMNDFEELSEILEGSSSFMDRVDTTGVLKKNTAQDLGVVGLPARACGIHLDLRKLPHAGGYSTLKFNIVVRESGDVLARLKVRMKEFEESVSLINQAVDKLEFAPPTLVGRVDVRGGYGLGFQEGWRGPVLYWLKLSNSGVIERCKIVDPSFHNWQGLAFAVLENIIPDFPLCNKSFDLSYAGNDL